MSHVFLCTSCLCLLPTFFPVKLYFIDLLVSVYLSLCFSFTIGQSVYFIPGVVFFFPFPVSASS